MKPRRKARIAALQALYELDCTTHPVEDVVAQRLEDTPLEVELADFTRRMVSGTLACAPRLDALITRHAPEWPLDQMALIDHNILRLALWEFVLGRLTPVKVAINEAVELAKAFGSESAPRFINGVLGSAAAELAEAPPG